jgi:aminoglycoside phosphotransferase (APT) family kinase protein
LAQNPPRYLGGYESRRNFKTRSKTRRKARKRENGESPAQDSLLICGRPESAGDSQGSAGASPHLTTAVLDAGLEFCFNAFMPAPLGTPAAEFLIDEALVHRLIAEQHADLAHLPLRAVGEGWDNAMFRLGEHLAVRLPRRAAGATLIGHEQRWLPVLSKQVSLPVPTPYRVGKPSQGYPWGWSVVPWLKGLTADQSEPSATQAAVFGGFLRSLHIHAPLDAPLNAVRGGPLQQRAASVQARMDRLGLQTDLITSQLRQVWDFALRAPLDGTPTWLHGDLHPRNVLVEDGVITGVIDWGDMCSGDSATDLASSWTLFGDTRSRQELWRAYGEISEPTLQRATGWALLFGLALLETGLNDNPRNAAIGEKILKRLADVG